MITYRPGTALAIAGPRTVVLLPPPTDQVLADRLWPVARTDADLEAYLALLLGSGLAALPSFGLLHAGPTGTVALLRGGVDVHAAGQSLSGAAVTTWTEHHFPATTTATLALTAEQSGNGDGNGDGGAWLPVLGGMIYVSAVTLSAAATERSDPMHAAPAADPGPALPLQPTEPPPPPQLLQATQPPPPPQPVPPPPAEPVSTHDASASTGLITGIPTALRPDPPAPRQAPAPTGDHDGHTVRRDAVAELQTATVRREPGTGTIRFADGRTVRISHGLVLGRDPMFHGSGGYVLEPLPVHSPNGDVSRSHLEIRANGAAVQVTDLGSTNGTEIAAPGRLPERLRPREPRAIEPGTTVNLAGEVTFVYEAGQP